jgi:hypothetical protein
MTDATSKDKQSATPSLDEMHAFLRERYKYERFEGRDGTAWCQNYSWVVAQSHLDYLREHGHGWISMYESATGRAIKYDTKLQVLQEAVPEGRNHGRQEGAVAPHHESAPTTGATGSADGVSIQPDLFRSAA